MQATATGNRDYYCQETTRSTAISNLLWPNVFAAMLFCPETAHYRRPSISESVLHMWRKITSRYRRHFSNFCSPLSLKESSTDGWRLTLGLIAEGMNESSRLAIFLFLPLHDIPFYEPLLVHRCMLKRDLFIGLPDIISKKNFAHGNHNSCGLTFLGVGQLANTRHFIEMTLTCGGLVLWSLHRTSSRLFP